VDHRGIDVRFPAGTRDVFVLCSFQTGSFLLFGEGFFLRSKAKEHNTGHLVHLVPRLRIHGAVSTFLRMPLWHALE
jgi:hypothetical protein